MTGDLGSEVSKLKKARPYRRRPASNRPGRPKTLGGDTQVVNLLLVRDVCAKIDAIVAARPDKYGSRSDFIREAIEIAVSDVHIVDMRDLTAEEKAGLGPPPKHWEGAVPPDLIESSSHPSKRSRPPRRS